MIKKIIEFIKFEIKFLLNSKKKNKIYHLTNFYCKKILIKADKNTLRKSYIISKIVNYDSNSRRLNSFIEGSIILNNDLSKKKLNILLIGYEHELYILDIFVYLGYEINVYFYDLNISDRIINNKILQKVKFHKIEDDIRNIDKYFSKPYFDYIFCSRSSIERFEYKEFISIINNLKKFLLDDYSLLISPVMTIFLNKQSLLYASENKKIKFLSENLKENNNSPNSLILLFDNLYDSEIDYLIDISNFLKEFNDMIDNPLISNFFKKKILLNKKEIEKISTTFDIDNMSRIRSLREISKKNEIFSTLYSHSVSPNKDKKVYISHYMIIKK